jgi:GT2 family glycosyltransferase/tetratricopeptide (TPR) repeat protein/2-polyprenyl-3-methyl-5-hydroxy-6-metoxy-1,4-benzoquinol methylase
MDIKLGCVIAVRDRPPGDLERAFRTYAYQTLQPLDRVLLDQGSAEGYAAAYRRLCARFGWRCVALPREGDWHASAACNSAVAALHPGVEVVFKSDLEVLLGRDVLETAALLGRSRLCVFSCLTLREGVPLPGELKDHRDLLGLLVGEPPPVPFEGEGVQAFPRGWFERVGGYDLAYRGWGYKDPDLRQRAGWSIGASVVSACLLVRPWRAPLRRPEDAQRNRLYYERTKASRQVVRNGGPLPVEQDQTPPRESREAHGPAGLLPELLPLIPPSARKVLAVGPRSGELGELLKQRQPATVHGVALGEREAAARACFDEVSVFDTDAAEGALPEGPFDCVVFPDVLARVRDPEGMLRLARERLAPGGMLVAGFANVRHHAVVASLLEGSWQWAPSGLFDRSHVRFFTRREAEKLLYRAGFSANEVRTAPGPGHEEWEARGRRAEVRVGGLEVRGLPDAGDFYAAGHAFSAAPTPARDHGLTSIVILTRDELDCTRLCVESIREHTPEPYELVFVDNASADGTREYLRSLPGVKVILNAENRGFPAGCNQGINASAGRQVLLLNNDTVVTTGWLRRMLDALHSGERVGLVGPCSNCVSGEQQVSASYDEDLVGLDGFAWEWGKAHDGEAHDADRLVGFCLLVRREVIDQVGLLDERFGTGCFEDDDYTRRALAAGWRAVVARDSFVHHFGSRTFRGAGVDLAGLLAANRELYLRKWEGEGGAGQGESAPAVARAPGEPKADREADPRVLLVAHVGTLRDRMDRSHYLRYEALARRPGVTLFGPGLPGYRPGMSVAEAVGVACAGVMPDVILHGGDLWESGAPLLAGLEDAPALTAVELLDSWTRPERQADFIRRRRFALGLIQEAGPHLEFYRGRCPDTEFFWAPNAVDVRLFHRRRVPKDCDVLLYGETSPAYYPLRARLARLLAKQSWLRFRHIRHPGYYPSGAGRDEVVSGAELSLAINRSWVGIATCSVFGCLLMKYLEVAASYAAVAGDMPEHARPLFGTDFIELGMHQSDEEILTRLRSGLADKERLEEMTAAAHERVVREYSTDSWAGKALALFRQALAARRAGKGSACEAKEGPAGPVREEALLPLSYDAGPPVEKTPSRDVVPHEDAPAPRYGLFAAPGGGLLLGRSSVRLSLCMIVRDNSGTLGPCLESIRPWVDEMVVVDTGSVDETPRIAERLGARVFSFPWCDDFSAARNESLKHARGEWLFWMDSDDVIAPECGRRLRELALGRKDPAVLGWVVQVHCPGPGEDGREDMTVVDHVKLFRNLPELRFEGRIHEQILPAIRRLGGQTAWTDLYVTHSGYDHSPDGQERKRQRDLHLLHLEHGERGEHPFTLFNLGMTYADVGRHAEAVDWLKRSIERSNAGESHLRKAYALLVHSLNRLGRAEEAWEACGRGLGLFPQDLELSFRRASLLHERGRLEESARAYLDVLETQRERHFTSVDRGIAGFKARHNLAVVYSDLGEPSRAEEQWRLVVREQPRYRHGWRGLGEALLRQGRRDDAEALAEQLLQDGLPEEGMMLHGQVALEAGDHGEAGRWFRRAAEALPADPAARQALCRLLFERGEPAEAEAALRDLLRLCPEDAAAHHNLGATLLRSGRPHEAAEEYRASLRLRPDAPATLFQLGVALRGAGRPEEAVGAWREALRLAPDFTEAAEALLQASQGQAEDPAAKGGRT